MVYLRNGSLRRETERVLLIKHRARAPRFISPGSTPAATHPRASARNKKARAHLEIENARGGRKTKVGRRARAALSRRRRFMRRRGINTERGREIQRGDNGASADPPGARRTPGSTSGGLFALANWLRGWERGGSSSAEEGVMNYSADKLLGGVGAQIVF